VAAKRRGYGQPYNRALRLLRTTVGVARRGHPLFVNVTAKPGGRKPQERPKQ